MDRDFESGKHEVVIITCANPNCGTEYSVQTGGQKSGSSPAVHIENVGETPKGYCSTRCQYKTKGWDLEPLMRYYKSFGIDYDRIFPPGYLAPGHKLNGKNIEIERESQSHEI
jgi:hypothetical protein